MQRSYGVRLSRTRKDAQFPWYCATLGDRAIVAISGTSKMDHWWKTNVFFQPDRLMHTDYTVHAGAARACARMWPDIEATTRDASEVLFLGHSLGGSLATMMALLRKDAMALTFGAPPMFARAPRDAPVFNVALEQDVVPRILGNMYQHAGQMGILRDDDLLIVDALAGVPVGKLHHDSRMYVRALKRIGHKNDRPASGQQRTTASNLSSM